MKTSAVISITLIDKTTGHGTTLEEDKELLLCTELLRKKYVTIPYAETSGRAEDLLTAPQKFVSALQHFDLLQQFSSEWEKGDRTKGGVGLYLQMHATQNKWAVQPDKLAEFVALLYMEFGLRFRKINLSGCNTAGGINDADPSDSMAMIFCQYLQKILSKDPSVINGLMVAGYRAVVTFAEIEGRPRNIDDEHKRILRPDITKRSDFEPKLNEVHQSTEPWNKRFAEVGTAKNENADFKTFWDGAIQYIRKKTAWRFVGAEQRWERIPLSTYSDNADFGTLIHKVETTYPQTLPGNKPGTRTTLLKAGFIV